MVTMVLTKLRTRSYILTINKALIAMLLVVGLCGASAQTLHPQEHADKPTVTTVSPSAPVTPFAGNGTVGFSGDGGPATQAQLHVSTGQTSVGLAFDSAGDLYFADTYNNRVRKVAAGTGIITTVAGGGTACAYLCGDGGPATSAVLFTPYSVALDSLGNLFIADTLNNVIRRVDASTGIITTFAGSSDCNSTNVTICGGITGNSGDGGPATSAELNKPDGVVVDSAGNVYIADTGNSVIRKVAAGTGIITAFAGGGSGCVTQTDTAGDGCAATSAILGAPVVLSFDATGNLYIAVQPTLASGTYSGVRVVNIHTGVISLFAGGLNPICTGALDDAGDGCPATQAVMYKPEGIAFDSNGNLYVSDMGTDTVREVDSSGVIKQAVGVYKSHGSGIAASTASTVELELLGALAFDASGNLFVSDVGDNVIREVGFGSNTTSAVTTTTLSSSNNPQMQGMSVTFTAKVQPASGTGVPTGTVTFAVDGATGTGVMLNGGQSAYSISTLTSGAHTINASYAGDSTYAASSASLTETIQGTAASVAVVTGSPQSVSYGSTFTNPLQVIVKDATGNPVPGAVVTFSGSGLAFSGSTATTGANGEASVTATAVAAGNLVAAASVSGVTTPASFALTATPAALTITASNISVAYGQSIPALTYTVTGFVRGDTQSVLSGAPSETTEATQSSVAGTYPITITQGTLKAANYSFLFANGTLTITSPGAVAPPVISPAGGTYTSAQTVTITDATQGAAIYYTIDGSTPTTSSTLYKAAFSVSSTETIKAIAVASGYANSAVATAVYTINAQAADFSLSLSPASIGVMAGGSGTTAITVTPLGGFNAAVSFACSGLPSGATCNFSAASVTPASGAVTTTLTINTSASTARLTPKQKPLWPIESLAAATLLCMTGMRRKRALLRAGTLACVSFFAMSLLGGCSSSSQPGNMSQTTTSVVTVTATSGSLTHTMTVTLSIS